MPDKKTEGNEGDTGELLKLSRAEIIKIVSDPSQPMWKISAAVKILKDAKSGQGADEGQRRNALKRIDLTQFANLNRQNLAEICGVSPSAIRGYVERGAPQNKDGTYNLAEFVHHIITKRQRGIEGINPDLDRHIKEETLRKKKLENDELDGSLVPRKTVDEILAARALSMVSFFRRAMAENVYLLEMKKADEMRSVIDEIVIQSVDVYRGKKKGDD